MRGVIECFPHSEFAGYEPQKRLNRVSATRPPSCRWMTGSLLVLLLAMPSPAQKEPAAAVRLSKESITVGEHFQLFVTASYPPDLIVKMPGAEQKLEPFEIVDVQLLEPEPSDDRISSSTVFTLTAFEVGNLEVPPITVGWVSADGSREGKIETNPAALRVDSVVTDGGSEIRDVKPPLEMPRSWRSTALTLLAAAFLGALGFWAFRHYRSRPSSAGQTERTGPPLPAHLVALRELERLRKSDILDRGEIKHFHTEVSEIIRRYFEGRFGIEALEMTSAEIVQNLQGQLDTVIRLSDEFLEQCDLVKFAKFVPVRARSDQALEMAFEIVDMTRPGPSGGEWTVSTPPPGHLSGAQGDGI